MPDPDEEGWTHYMFERDPNPKMYVHSQEMFEGEWFSSVRTYDANRKLEIVILTRLDLVRG